MRTLLALLLTGCLIEQPPATPQPNVPYPDAEGIGSIGAMAPSPESDCMGAIKISEPFRDGTWTLGAKDSLGKFESLLVFNTEKDARSCLGTSRDFLLRIRRGKEWAMR